MADAGYLTIGKLVKRLQAQYPDLSVSKVRYLEDEGLLTPSRTPGGYRLYSARDIKRLESILYLQKNRFMPLSVIKDELDKADDPSDATHAAVQNGGSILESFSTDDEKTASKFHPIDRMPEILGVSTSFVRQLSEAGVVTLRRSPHGRDLVDGRDFPLIRIADQLRRFDIGPRNLRQYVTAANRESTMYEQALIVFGRAGSDADEKDRRAAREAALNQMLALTDALHDSLVKRNVLGSDNQSGHSQHS